MSKLIIGERKTYLIEVRNAKNDNIVKRYKTHSMPLAYLLYIWNFEIKQRIVDMEIY